LNDTRHHATSESRSKGRAQTLFFNPADLAVRARNKNMFRKPWKGTGRKQSWPCAVDVVHVDAVAGWRHQALILEAF